jgi:hypothetical protein
MEVQGLTNQAEYDRIRALVKLDHLMVLRWCAGTMEVQGLTNQAEYDRIRALTKVTSPDAARKIAGFLNKVGVTSSNGVRYLKGLSHEMDLAFEDINRGRGQF